MKKPSVILLAVIAAVLILLFAKDIMIKASVGKGVEIITGLKLKIGNLKVGVLKPIVDIKDLKLLNPSSFPDRTMADMPEIYVKYDLPAIIGGKIHLPEFRLALKEFVVVKNSKGELNLDSLRTVQAQKEGKEPAQKAPGKAPQVKIDLLKLRIGKVIYKDYSKGPTPDIREFNVNLDETYTNVDNPYTLANLIVVKALMNTSIAALINFNLERLQGTVGNVLPEAQKIVSTVTDTAQDTIQKTSETVKDIFKNPFGSGK